jgi:hypothetical protein
MFVDTAMIRQQRVTALQQEADELCAMVTSSPNTARKNAKLPNENRKNPSA